MTEEIPADVEQLDLLTIIGFNGSIPGGLKVHPGREHLIYPLGCTIIIQSINDQKQHFLSGHTNDVSCLAVSKSGKYLASGQVTHMGFKADIIIWDFESRSIYCRLTLHKVKVESLAFSPNDKYLVSLGGQDDGSVVVWDVAKKDAVCGSPAAVPSAGKTMAITYANNTDDKFVTGGDQTLRVWELDLPNRKIRPTEVYTGQLKRIINCMEVDESDKFVYCGTTTGDVIQVNMSQEKAIMANYGPQKEKFSLGVTSLALIKTGEILVGAGDGTVAIIKGKNFKCAKSTKLDGAINSIALRGQGHQFFVGTSMSHMYKFNYAEFTNELINTCHYSEVNDISFPFSTSELFATCSKNDIRVWNSKTGKELLRMTIPNMTCHAIEFMRDGKSIISAWDDGKIRAFYPESGRLMYVIQDAHNKGVTSLALTSDCRHIISGGGEGQVRVWDIGPKTQALREAMKEHKGTVTSIKVRKNDEECVSASTDGTCIIWDLKRFVRNQVIFANTLFMCVNYHPEEFQIITSGTDRKVGYWEVFDGSQIRELDGSRSGSVNGMDISVDGLHFVTGGDDKLIKVWKYNEGEITSLGTGHSGSIKCLKICPLQKIIVSVSKDGAIICWKYPHPNLDAAI